MLPVLWHLAGTLDLNTGGNVCNSPGAPQTRVWKLDFCMVVMHGCIMCMVE